MKALRCPAPRALRLLALLPATVLLVQCAMPTQQAWRYIQTNGLLPYLSYSSQHQSPPFGSSQRYAGSSSYRGRSTPAPNWFSNWSSGMPNRVRYRTPYSSSSASNRYFNTPVASSPSESPRPKPRPQSSPAPKVKIPMEEPVPQVASNAPSSSSPSPAPTPNVDATAQKPSVANLPYGTPVPGRMNMVNSPYAGKTQLVDVSGMSPGQTVKCPYSGKLFKVPPTQQASNNSAQRKDSKLEAPPTNAEPKPGN